MSIVISTDVFCDGDGCLTWAGESTVTGPRMASRDAREKARSWEGWQVGLPGGRDLCPDCAAREGHTPRR